MRRAVWFLVACFLLAESGGSAARPGSPQAKAVQSPPPAQETLASPNPTSGPAATNLTADKNGALSRDQIHALVSKVAANDLANEKRQRDYTYTRSEILRKLNGQGQVTSTESKTYEVMVLYDEPVERMIAKDDKPLAAKDADKEESRIAKLTDKRKNEAPEDRQKRLAKEAKERDEDRAFEREVADAYDFRLAGVEKIDGRDAYVFDGEPRPGYEPHLKQAKVLPKFRVRVWIDKAETQWVKIDAEAIDTVSFGLFLARIHKGSRVEVEQTRINDEVWLPKHIAIKVDARLALLKSYDLSIDEAYRDYKKFRTATRILGIGQAEEH